MFINFRQGIITYPTVGSNQNFLTRSSVWVVLNAANGPTSVSFAHRTTNYSITESVTVTQAWGPIPPSTDSWLYWDIDTRTGELTRGFTLIQPTFGPAAPSSPVENQHWFDTVNICMKVYISGGWREKIRVFAAKVNDSTFTPLGSGVPGLPYAGTQVGLSNVSSRTGNIVFDDNGNPIRRSTGEFFTTESLFFVSGSPVTALRLDASVLLATAQENMAAYHVVKFTDFGKVSLANYNDTGETALAMVMESGGVNEVVSCTTQGTITNSNWNWTIPGGPLWISENGELTETDPHTVDVITYPQSRAPIARILSATEIIFDQGFGARGQPGPPGPTGTPNLATDAVSGVVRLSVAAVDNMDPIAVGDNDPRMTNARMPLLHTHTADEVAFTPYGTISSVDVNGAIRELEDNKLSTTGGTMSGPLELVGDPVSELQPATKQYVDNLFLYDLNDVTINSPLINEVIAWNGAKWVNSPAPSFSTILTLNDLTDVLVPTPSSGDVLIFTGTEWENQSLSLNNLDDVEIITPSSGEVLTFTGAEWENQPISLSIDDLTDVVLNSPMNGDVLTFNGSEWENQPSAGGGVTELPYDISFFIPGTAADTSGALIGLFVASKNITIGDGLSFTFASYAYALTPPDDPTNLEISINGTKIGDISFSNGDNEGSFSSSGPSLEMIPGDRLTITVDVANSVLENLAITLAGCTSDLVCPS